MRPKGANGAAHQPPNHKWAHLSQFWPQNPTNSGPQVGHNAVHGFWKPPEATSSAPRKDSPQVQRKTFPSSRIQKWCMYGDSKSSPNLSPFSKGDSSATQSGNSLAATRRPFEDPNHLALQELGC
ncbi:hypothetical protein O181_033553 [Austropuccinia psidii MF-1]|uniref:Uncharacterized protein n=1 Tax=Austropuccinia psidii MF-1 TaxID=1389203 RepID=A0A9Q3H6J9_9BASI|nr:hypothetical protein [Austropuccinia psidii MF-1]